MFAQILSALAAIPALARLLEQLASLIVEAVNTAKEKAKSKSVKDAIDEAKETNDPSKIEDHFKHP